jgi:hypothetical protein
MKKTALLVLLSLCMPLIAAAQTDDVIAMLLAQVGTPAVTQSASSTVSLEPSAESVPVPASAAQSAPVITALQGSVPYTLFAIDGNVTKPSSEIASLQAMLASLVSQLAAIASSTPAVATSSATSTEVSEEEIETAFEFTRDLKIGSRGTDVQALQDLLEGLGFFVGESTGYYGVQTRNAVQAFQFDRGLPTVGVVGPRTRTSLNDALQAGDEMLVEAPKQGLITIATSTPMNFPTATSSTATSSDATATSTPATAEAGPVDMQMTLMPNKAPVGGSVSIMWISQNATTCEASDGWTGAKPTMGAAVIEPLAFSLNFVLTCTGPGGSASTSALVEVGEE